ncbi:WD40-repeat-containing domain protein [Lentinula raphanica]|nr:WD40-repeat-containing domain protein [Lentinula raphanica]
MLNPSYSLLGCIEAPTNAINALAFSKDGKYLASGGDDMFVRVYDISRNLSTIWTHRGKSPFTTALWHGDCLFVGNGDGEVFIFRPTMYWFHTKRREQLIAEFYNPIQFLELDQVGTQLLVCSGSRTTLLVERKPGQWKSRSHFDSPSSFAEIPQYGEPDGFEEPPVLATSAHFLDEKGYIVVAYLHHGLWKYETENGTSVLAWGPDEKIGSTALSPDGQALVATNIRSGLDWYKTSTHSKWKKMSSSPEVSEPNSNIPLPVCFIDKGKHVIMGTSKGYAVIFHSKHGRKLLSLDHGNDRTWVTALKSQLIATGDGNCGVDTRIKVWISDADADNAKSLLMIKDLTRLLTAPVRWLRGLTGLLRFLIKISYNILAIAGLTFLILRLLPPQYMDDIQQSLATVFSLKSSITSDHPLPTSTTLEPPFSRTSSKHQHHTWMRESLAQPVSFDRKTHVSSVTTAPKVWIMPASITTSTTSTVSTVPSTDTVSTVPSMDTVSTVSSTATVSTAFSTATQSTSESGMWDQIFEL